MLIAGPAVALSIPVQSYTFAEIDCEIFYRAIPLLPADSRMVVWLLSVMSESMYTKYWLTA